MTRARAWLLAAACGGAAASSHPTSCAVANEGEEIVFDCGGDLISAVEFGSYGRPRGTCGDSSFERDDGCHAAQTVSSLEDRCLGQATCLFTVTASTFGGAPHCSGGNSKRWLAAVLQCGDSSTVAPTVAPTGLGIGWQFNMFVFVVVVLYCGLGVAYNIYRKGAKGVDAVPHLETWKDLPFLVRDGIIFAVDTIKSKGRPGYDGL